MARSAHLSHKAQAQTACYNEYRALRTLCVRVFRDEVLHCCTVSEGIISPLSFLSHIAMLQIAESHESARPAKEPISW